MDSAPNGTQITDKMPAILRRRRQRGLHQRFELREGHLQPERHHAAERAEDHLKVHATFNKEVMGKTIDLTKTYTDEFVNAATPLS